MEEQLAEPIEQMLDRMHADAAFGEPVKVDQATVIPVAEVQVAFGYGRQVGSGVLGPVIVKLREVSAGSGHVNVSQKADSEAGPTEAPDEGSAVGSGGRGRVLPRGYIQITPEGVGFKEIIDVDRLGMAGIALVAWAVFWLRRRR